MQTLFLEGTENEAGLALEKLEYKEPKTKILRLRSKTSEKEILPTPTNSLDPL